MKYILAIGIFFKKFSNSTKLRIFSDDLFIDEVILDENLLGEEKVQFTHTHYDNKMELLNPKPTPKKLYMKFPEKVFVYEIDRSAIGEKIFFEIDDTNSNYTNGFMTDSNMFAIHNVFLFPKHMFSEEKLSRVLEFMRKIYNRDDLDRLNANDIKEYTRKYVQWPSQFNHFDSDSKTMYMRNHWHGGRKRLHMNIRKKFGLHFLWNGREESSDTIKFGNPKEFIEYNRYYRLINTINEN